MNTEKLYMAVRESGDEENVFYFDPRIIDWENYFEHIHLPGVRQRPFDHNNFTIQISRTIDSLALGYGKGTLTCFLGNPDGIYDVIPADMVVNAMIAAVAAHANLTCLETIYHVGSSVSNPLKFSTIQRCGYRYFTDHPCVGKDGKPITVGEVTVLNSLSSFHRYIALRYLLPLQV
ncbi:hypothetical protein M8C21_007791 [Ambrosia artemisiifolia]|uniref:Fatty acyl-CoA reductase n=1 Tax=Ambrosia artemisiifolia TaxID=4212 RepID=A0AAD5BZS7_AMBAR|nr:hypothetical protein M8C21_007791 [Ambrosia artemisiifolia]